MGVRVGALVEGRLGRRLLLGLRRLSRHLRHGIMLRYIEGDRGRGGLGVIGMNRMGLEGSFVLPYVNFLGS